MKIALAHDYLKEAGGAERVLRVLAEMYPEAPIYTAFAVRNSRAAKMFSDREIIESGWGWFLKIGRFYSYFRFLLPQVWKSVDLSDYDLVVTSCSGYVARGFKVGKRTRVVAYCHTPPKWLYGYETPTGARRKWWGAAYLWLVGPWVRYFDYQAAQRVNQWIANSREVAGRIAKFYRKKATMVYPPIEVREERVGKSGSRGEYYLVVGRLVGAKGVELAIKACRKLERKLVVAGEGSKNYGKQDGITYAGWVSEKRLTELYARARGYLALAKDEDFGMTVVEAIAQGTPVVALRSGGYKETVIPGKTGVLVEDMSVQRVVKGMKKLEKTKWKRGEMKRWAKKFGKKRFEREMRKAVNA